MSVIVQGRIYELKTVGANLDILHTLEFLINEGLRLLIFGKFSSPYALIKDPTFI